MKSYEGKVNGKPIVYTDKGIRFGDVPVRFDQMTDIRIVPGQVPSWQFTYNGRRMKVPYMDTEREIIEPFIKNAIQEQGMQDLFDALEIPQDEQTVVRGEPVSLDPQPAQGFDQPQTMYSNTGTPYQVRAKRPFYKRPVLIIPAIVLLLMIIGGISMGGDDSDMETSDITVTTEMTTEEETETAAPVEKSTTTENTTEKSTKAKPETEMTPSQKNAYKAAKNYLEFMAFSKEGLIDQLSSEYGDGYDRADAEFAVNKIEEDGDVDWNEQAEKAAQNYLDSMAFSKDGLIEQLESEYGDKFTHEQAVHGVEAVYDSQ